MSEGPGGAATAERAGVPSSGPEYAQHRPRPPYERRLSLLPHANLAQIYIAIKAARSELKLLNTQIEDAQQEAFQDIARGERVRGWLLVGHGLSYLDKVEMIEGRSRDDVRWAELQKLPTLSSKLAFWTVVGAIALLLAATLMPVAALALSDAPDFAHVFPFLEKLTSGSLGPSLAVTIVPALAGTLFVFIALAIVTYCSRYSGSPSVFGAQFLAFKATFLILTVIAGIWLIAVSAIMFGLQAFNIAWNQPGSVADGSIYIAVLCLTIVINLACIAPAILLLNPPRFFKVRRLGRQAITPRQRFRAMYPRTYNYSHATAFCIIGIIFAATFTLLFPLIGPAIVLLLLLSCVAHRFLIGYVYQRGGQAGGILQLWVIRRFADLLALQPLLLGLLLLSREEWAIGGVLLGVGLLLIVVVEHHTWRKSRAASIKTLSNNTQHALQTFKENISGRRRQGGEGESLVSGTPTQSAVPQSQEAGTGRHRRGSIASILDMMTVALAVMPSGRQSQPVPLPTENIDDLISTAKAARTRPNVPEDSPAVVALATNFEDPAEETAGLLYSPELLAPVPIVWLPDDGDAGVARAEASDLQRYHGLLTILDVIPQRART